jgi:hypothetical protein
MFLSFHSFQSMKSGKSCQVLFRIGILKEPEPQSLIILVIFFLISFGYSHELRGLVPYVLAEWGSV